MYSGGINTVHAVEHGSQQEKIFFSSPIFELFQQWNHCLTNQDLTSGQRDGKWNWNI